MFSVPRQVNASLSWVLRLKVHYLEDEWPVLKVVSVELRALTHTKICIIKKMIVYAFCFKNGLQVKRQDDK